MQTKEWRWSDEVFKRHEMPPKSTWGEGEWQNEPDKKQWQDEKTGYPCLIHRGSSGSLCGYVGISEGHNLHKVDYDGFSVEVHGGLTYSGFCNPSSEDEYGICHVPEPGDPDNVWWVGFDTAHAFDYCPAIRAVLRGMGSDLDRGDTYRTMDYVEAEVASLAAQLKALEVAS